MNNMRDLIFFSCFNDVFGIRFEADHINTGDCFHPSIEGQAYLAHNQWEQSPWADSYVCTEVQQGSVLAPWLYLLLFD